jgi:hypothetical protein
MGGEVGLAAIDDFADEIKRHRLPRHVRLRVDARFGERDLEGHRRQMRLRTTAVNVSFKVPLHDARPIASVLTLEKHGFSLVGHRSAVKNFYDDEEVKKVYYPEAERLLERLTGASRVFIFDHTRRRVLGSEDRRGGIRRRVSRVHVDHTAKSSPQRVRDLLPDEAQGLLRGRVQVIRAITRCAAGGL